MRGKGSQGDSVVMNQPVPEEKILDMMRQEGRARSIPRSLPERLKSLFTPCRIELASRLMLGLALVLFAAVWFVSPDAVSGKDSSGVQEEWAGVSEAVAPLEDYLDDIAKRDIFRHHLAKELPENSDLPYLDSVAHITLAGVVLEDPPQAVLKDTRTGSVFYVKTGAMLGEFKVVSIEEGKITLEYGDEKIDLRM
jgi:hypothetical protein